MIFRNSDRLKNVKMISKSMKLMETIISKTWSTWKNDLINFGKQCSIFGRQTFGQFSINAVYSHPSECKNRYMYAIAVADRR